jgi:hypothetical protein
MLKIFLGVSCGCLEYILSEVYFFYTNLILNIYLCQKIGCMNIIEKESEVINSAIFNGFAIPSFWVDGSLKKLPISDRRSIKFLMIHNWLNFKHDLYVDMRMLYSGLWNFSIINYKSGKKLNVQGGSSSDYQDIFSTGLLEAIRLIKK